MRSARSPLPCPPCSWLLIAAAACQAPGAGSKDDSASPDSAAPDSGAPDSDAPDSDTPDSDAPDSDPPDSDTGATGGSFAAETSVSDALARILSTQADSDLGRIVRLGDLDGDGQLDAIAAAFLDQGRTGGAWAVPGPVTVSGSAQDLGWHLEGAVRGAGTGRSMSVGDVDGDGYADLGLGAPYDSADNGLYLSPGPTTGDVALSDAGVALLRGPTSTYAGHGSDISGDVSGDGVADAVVGAYYTASQKGLTFVAFGPITGDLSLETEADVVLEGEAADVYAGRTVRAGADLNGDGVGELVIACLGTLGPPGSGGFYVVQGPMAGSIDLADADGRYAGESYGGAAGLWLDADDLDGDGLADVVAAASDSTLAATAGAAFVVLGPAESDSSLAVADLIVRGDVEGQYGGGGALGDLDGDGTAELLLGAQGDPTLGLNAGALYLFQDPAPGSYVFGDADAAFFAEGPGDNLGTGMAVGDVDGDHLAEIVIGAPYQDAGASKAGAFYVMHAL